jgi:hypothetical protein
LSVFCPRTLTAWGKFPKTTISEEKIPDCSEVGIFETVQDESQKRRTINGIFVSIFVCMKAPQ